MFTEGTVIRIMRLWRDSMATPVYVGLSLERALRWLHECDVDCAHWIEDERRPAVTLGADWRPRS